MTCSLRAFGHAPRTSTAPADATAAANDVPCGRRYSCGTAVGVPLVGAERPSRGDRPGQRREQLVARGGEVVVDRIAVREARHGAVTRERAHAEDVRQSRRIARVAPRHLGRVVAVPDGRDDDHALADRVLDRAGLERGEAVPALVCRVTHSAEAEVDDRGTLVDRPADRTCLRLEWDDAVRANDFRDEQLGRERHAGDPLSVVERRRDQAGDERAVAVPVTPRRATDEAPRRGDPTCELRMSPIDARVDHGDAHRGKRWPLEPGVECLHRIEVPLAGRHRVRRQEGERSPPGSQPLDVGDARKPRDPSDAGRIEREREGSERLDLPACALFDGPGHHCSVRAGRDADGVPGRIRGSRQRQREHGDREEASHPVTTRV